MSDHLRKLLRSQITVERAIQTELDQLVAPTTTGYMHSKESWTVAFVREGEHTTEIEIGLDPPERAYEWHRLTAKRLQILQTQLGCDDIHGFARESGRVRYVAWWNRPEGTNP